MSVSIKSKWVYAALVASFTVGCTADAASRSETGQSDVVIGIGDLANKVAVHEDRLEFDADVSSRLEKSGLLAKIDTYASAPGNAAVEPVYLVGNRQSNAMSADGSIKEGARNPAGYLRRARSWHKGEDGKVIVDTAHASLDEAIEEIKKNGFAEVGSKSVRPLADGVDTANGFGDTHRTWHHTFGSDDGFTAIDLSGKEIWTHPLLTGGNAKIVLKTGKITLKPTVDAELLIETFIPQHASAILSADVEGVIEVEATADGAFEVFEGGTLWSKSFGGAGGGVPLTMSIEVKWDCGIGATGKSVTTVGATAKGSLRAGGKFEGLDLTAILDRPSFDLARLGPTLNSNVNVNGVCHLIPELSLQVFDAAGPKVSLDLYASLSANASNVQLGARASASVKAGVVTKVAGSLKPFGFTIASIDATPFKYEKEIFNGLITVGQQ